MQSLSSQHPNNFNQQTRKIAVVAILLFACSGLISGFAVGAFVHPKAQTGTGTGTGATGSGTTQIVHATHTPSTVQTQTPEELGYPVIDKSVFIYRELADGQTTYTYSAHAVYANGNRVHSLGITCKLWLTKDTVDLQRSEWTPISAVNHPIGGEIQGAFSFDSTTPQVQNCDANAQATWKYQVSPSVEPGPYYLAVLTDWVGKHYNIWWQQVIIKKAN
jgi:hypothetical protein